MTGGRKGVLQAAERPSLVLGLACLLLHLIVNKRYDTFRDELYFIVCGRHPALGYVDQPPLIPLVAGASDALFGTALLPLRLLPALAMSATVALACDLVRRLGGGRFAQWLCGLAVLTGPVFLADGLLLTTDALQPLTWLACSYCLVRLAQTQDQRWWLGFGLAAGLSLTSKYLILFYLAGLAVGVVCTPLRRALLQLWVYLGAAVALLLPGAQLVWQAENGWPFLELNSAATSGKKSLQSPLAAIGQQILFVGPATAPIWIAGLWRFSVRPPPAALRVFPLAYAVMAALFYALHGKAYYLAPVYPVLLAGGALAIERWLTGRAYRWLAARAVTMRARLPRRSSCPSCRPATTADTPVRSASRRGRRRPNAARNRRCRSFSRTCLAGARWPRKSAPPTTHFRRMSGPRPCSSAATTARPPP